MTDLEHAYNYTYILRCGDGSLYTGWTNDLDKRLKAHNGGKSGAKYTRNRRPVTLVYYEEFQEKQEAMKREYAIKQLTRKEKENLIKEKIYSRKVFRIQKEALSKIRTSEILSFFGKNARGILE